MSGERTADVCKFAGGDRVVESDGRFLGRSAKFGKARQGETQIQICLRKGFSWLFALQDITFLIDFFRHVRNLQYLDTFHLQT